MRWTLTRRAKHYLNNALSTTSPTDHNGYDERSAFLTEVDGGKFRLVP
ncbi:branched-chain amino acid transport system substrate-binding protein [Bradyrhizobium shewense]|uniref:Branched-chain amino acid transport system substrate-binding protein n=1 Tax=Bradyrhizobium shewense TaxID=1761772 RepID=A0A1C3U5W2_9BRAD|nr:MULTISPECIES: hypothetical protein [Bradyrhizobium]SCB10856.1 branched-chain amino acid transport system substrate-binding protein [Bradyrhizobium shewense]